MDDFNLGSLNESRNEWVSRLLNVMTPNIADGFKALFTDAYTLCLENDETEKYLMTFQNFLGRIPKWNEDLISNEVERITNNSGCGYLEDLITCVHVVQLKALTCIRVGQKQKKVDIDIPKLSEFVHKCYINVARKLYSNIYLFEKDVAPLQQQKHSREFEIIVKEGIIISSPFFKFRDLIIISNAAVPLVTVMPNFLLLKFENFFSNCLTAGPSEEIQPVVKALLTSFLSCENILGVLTGINLFFNFNF